MLKRYCTRITSALRDTTYLVRVITSKVT